MILPPDYLEKIWDPSPEGDAVRHGGVWAVSCVALVIGLAVFYKLAPDKNDAEPAKGWKQGATIICKMTNGEASVPTRGFGNAQIRRMNTLVAAGTCRP